MADLDFETLTTSEPVMEGKRARVPGGWLVYIDYPKCESIPSLCFVPDPEHNWLSAE